MNVLDQTDVDLEGCRHREQPEEASVEPIAAEATLSVTFDLPYTVEGAREGEILVRRVLRDQFGCHPEAVTTTPGSITVLAIMNPDDFMTAILSAAAIGGAALLKGAVAELGKRWIGTTLDKSPKSSLRPQPEPTPSDAVSAPISLPGGLEVARISGALIEQTVVAHGVVDRQRTNYEGLRSALGVSVSVSYVTPSFAITSRSTFKEGMFHCGLEFRPSEKAEDAPSSSEKGAKLP